MSTSIVNQLGYIGLDVADVARWERFATDTLGLERVADDETGAASFRMDANHHRITVTGGVRDDLAHVGWEVPDADALRDVAERLESHGFEVAWGTGQDARRRCVMGLITTCDPSGVTTEIFHGPLVRVDVPFRSPRSIGGFVAGRLGLGHIVLAVDDCEASVRFYRDVLGLRVSDYIELDMGTMGSTTAVFLHCGPRHHSLALVQVPATKRLHHMMLELRDLDDVGRTYDLCHDQGVPITSTLGCHTNDKMMSFYMETPSGFQVEYGHGGLLIDDDTWEVQLHQAPSIWGHRTPA
jgi:2,3-dihydroxybiphenyl 1,2-dioxygenase